MTINKQIDEVCEDAQFFIREMEALNCRDFLREATEVQANNSQIENEVFLQGYSYDDAIKALQDNEDEIDALIDRLVDMKKVYKSLKGTVEIKKEHHKIDLDNAE